MGYSPTGLMVSTFGTLPIHATLISFTGTSKNKSDAPKLVTNMEYDQYISRAVLKQSINNRKAICVREVSQSR